jgi:alkyldihydroxyacetonephosphate synthase
MASSTSSAAWRDRRVRWWGWGEDAHALELPPATEQLLRSQLGLEGEPSPPVALEDVRLREPALPDVVAARLREAVGEKHLRADRLARVSHALGRSYPDLVRIRSGDASSAPDAVALPASPEQVKAVLRTCSEAGIAVVPFGGGTSVVGGVEPLREGFAGAISLDLARLDRVLSVDRTSLTATLQAGVFGPAAEDLLAREGLTLGHFPQSFEFSTVGGWVATRSAGAASTGHGRIDELVEAVRLVAPGGELGTRPVPSTAAGPALRELVVGSEGVLGVIPEATLRVRPLPETRRYEGWSFRTLEEGVEAFRAMEQAGASPDVARLSDGEETGLTMALGSSGSRAERLGRRYVRLRGHERGCVAIAGFEGSEGEVARRRGRCAEALRGGGGLYLGQGPGNAWLRGRYAAPYLRDALLGRGVLAETLETATSWSAVLGLHRAVGDALRRSLGARGTPPLVMCHLSHLYTSGASLYFTVLARQERGAELEQWDAAKAAASDAIMANGGTITHHHAVGRDHARWMPREVGVVGLDLIRAAKERLDPRGVMNPGKLLPA